MYSSVAELMTITNGYWVLSTYNILLILRDCPSWID